MYIPEFISLLSDLCFMRSNPVDTVRIFLQGDKDGFQLIANGGEFLHNGTAD